MSMESVGVTQVLYRSTKCRYPMLLPPLVYLPIRMDIRISVRRKQAGDHQEVWTSEW